MALEVFNKMVGLFNPILKCDKCGHEVVGKVDVDSATNNVQITLSDTALDLSRWGLVDGKYLCPCCCMVDSGYVSKLDWHIASRHCITCAYAELPNPLLNKEYKVTRASLLHGLEQLDIRGFTGCHSFCKNSFYKKAGYNCLVDTCDMYVKVEEV